MGVVSWRRIGYAAWASRVNVAQIMGEKLYLIHVEVVVIVKDKVSARTARPLFKSKQKPINEKNLAVMVS